MARRRVPSRTGGRNDALMALYGDITARERAREQAAFQSQLNMELARLQKRLEIENARERQGIDTVQSMIPGVLSGDVSPSQIAGAGLSSYFPGDISALAPSPQQRLSPFLKQTREAKTRFEVPGEEDIFGVLGTTRETAEPSMLEAATGAMRARESRLADIGAAEDIETLLKGTQAQETALGQARGQEAGAVEAFPALLARDLESQNVLGAAKFAQEKQQFGEMTGLEVARARQMAQAQAEVKNEVEQSAGDRAGLIAVASSEPLAQNLMETIVGPQGTDPSGRPYPQDRFALAGVDPNTGLKATPAFKNAYGPARGLAMGYLDPNVQARINRLTSQQVTQALTDLRKQVSTGASPMGQASDRDVLIVQNGVSQLASYRMDPAAAEAELKRIYDAALRLQQRAQAAKGALGSGVPPALNLQTPSTPSEPSAGRNIRTSSGKSFTVRPQ